MRAVRIDPARASLAETAGYDDPERWWEDVVEHRGTGGGGRAPAARPPGCREGAEPGDGDPDGPADVRVDPLRVLAQTAGYDEPERWWEDVVEHRGTSGPEADAFAPFDALGEAMGALREVYGDGGHDRDLVREAYMRLQLRAAAKEFGAGRRGRVRGLARAGAAADEHRGRRPGAAQGAAEGEGRHDLGAVDAPPALPRQRVRRGDRLARAGTAICSARPTGPSSAG